MATKKTAKKAAKPAKKSLETPENAPEEAKSESQGTEKAPKGEYVGRTLKIKMPSGAEFEGLCVSERGIPGGQKQVFLKLNGLVSRFFNAEDIVK